MDKTNNNRSPRCRVKPRTTRAWRTQRTDRVRKRPTRNVLGEDGEPVFRQLARECVTRQSNNTRVIKRNQIRDLALECLLGYSRVITVKELPNNELPVSLSLEQLDAPSAT